MRTGKRFFMEDDANISFNKFLNICLSMLCNLNDTSYDVSRNFKNSLLCIRTFNYELWNNFLEKPAT